MPRTPPHLPDAEPAGAPLRLVQLVSGQPLHVQGDDERAWFISRRDTYLEENRFTAVTDLQDLDRLLIMELMVHRWTVQLASGLDYDEQLVDAEQLRKSIQQANSEILKIKDSMALSKAARDRAATESVAEYVGQLKRRAKEFGIHRERQLDRALTLVNELSTLVGTLDRADEEERRKLDLSQDSVLAWIRDTMLPEFRELDQHFRERQKYWVRSV